MGIGWIGLWMGLASGGVLTADSDPQSIVNGSAVGVCGWPTTVNTGGCTATLVHPKAISTAQHCGAPTSIQFGETAGAGPTVGVLGCVGDGSQDAMLCELAEEVTEVPVTPVLFGCEAEMYLQPGQPVVMAGFGQTSYGVGGGTKLWADQEIAQVEAGRVIVGQAGDGTSPCPGDSGGPVFVQVADGSWRVFGTVLGGTTSTPCNSAADFQRIDAVVANFEAQRGLDITPCFDGATGAWDAGPDCGSFFAGDEVGVGTWDAWCEGTPVSGYSETCGPAFGDDGGGSSGGETSGATEGGEESSATEGDAGTGGGGTGTGGEDSGTSTSGYDDDDDGDAGTGTGGQPQSGGSDGTDSGCRVGGSSDDRVAWWLLAGLGLAWRRRR